LEKEWKKVEEMKQAKEEPTPVEPPKQKKQWKKDNNKKKQQNVHKRFSSAIIPFSPSKVTKLVKFTINLRSDPLGN
jgi:hypothetical protein